MRNCQRGVGRLRPVHVISRKKLKEAAIKYASCEAALDTWYRVAKKASWKNLAEVRKTYPHADPVGDYTVFNIKGNDYRLIVEIFYEYNRIFIRHVLTHAEYKKGKWKS